MQPATMAQIQRQCASSLDLTQRGLAEALLECAAVPAGCRAAVANADPQTRATVESFIASQMPALEPPAARCS